MRIFNDSNLPGDAQMLPAFEEYLEEGHGESNHLSTSISPETLEKFQDGKIPRIFCRLKKIAS